MPDSLTILDASGVRRQISARDPDGRLLTAAQAAYLSGLFPAPALCSGLGRCGRCRVRFLSPAPAPGAEDTVLLDPAELEQGWRLGCRHPAAPGAQIEIPAAPRAPEAAAPRPDRALALACDLGTTSLKWAALDSAGQVAAEGWELNPQLGAGAEVMSRLAHAATPGGARQLRTLVLDALRRACAGLPGRAESLAVAGNPAMTLLLLGLPSSGLAAAPYRLDYRGGRMEALAPDLPEAYILPLLAPFVGGDVSAGLASLALGRDAPAPPWVLADLGTNGEFALVLPDGRLLLASVPLGPALEGVGMRFGRLAEPGAVCAFLLTPQGLAPLRLPGGPEVPGITGAGYLSLLARLRSLGVLDPGGRFAAGDTPLARRVAAGLGPRAGEPCLDLPGGMHLPARDVEELLKVKAAFDLALSRLLAEAGLDARDLSAVCLAGALGRHAAPADLEDLGFLPPGLGGRVRAVGNTSLAGASLVLADPAARAWVEGLPDRCRVLDLAADPGFQAAYLARMRFVHVGASA
ncbi:MAG: ASKHA domain-containing protein [Thermodesulfobacteriota bacterium]